MDNLNQIKQKIDIVDFIGETVHLKKAGRNFKGLCPFHSEKTPSFVVSPERQIWHCFGGCQKGGDIFTFLMEIDHLEFFEALKILASRANVKLENQIGNSKQTILKQTISKAHILAKEYFHYLLVNHKIGERARVYLKERGITDKAIKTFELGFAPNAWDNLHKYLLKKGFKSSDLEIGGLIIKGRSGFYDRFRSRIIFPLKNYRGDTIGFSGRVFEKKPQEAKYINSPETPIYIKGETLYGMDVTKEAIKKLGKVIVVEGEFDLISSFQAGITNVVAIKGSALTQMQVNLLKRFTEKLILSLDNDKAGDAASRRGIEIADKAGMEIRVISIPNSKDPDEAVRENPLEWKKAVIDAIPFYDFLINSSFSRFTGKEAFDKKKISDELLPVFAKIENPVIQAHYLKILANKLEISEEKIDQALQRVKLPRSIDQNIALQKPDLKTHNELIEEHLLSFVMQADDVVDALSQITQNIDPSDFVSIPIQKIFMYLIDYSLNNEKIVINDFIKTLPSEIIPVVDQAFLKDLSVFSDKDIFNKELVKAINIAKIGILRRKIKNYSTKLVVASDLDNTDNEKELKAKLEEAVSALKELS